MNRERTVVAPHKRTCKVPRCGMAAISRGLCATHYQTAYQLIMVGKTTWEELEQRGRVDPARVATGRDWFLA